MKDQTAAGRRQASRYDAWAIVASLLLVGCGVTGQDKSRGDTGSCETCSVDAGGASGSSAAGTCGESCTGEPAQTSTVTATTTSVDTRSSTLAATSNNASVDTSNALDAGSSAGSDVAPLDAGQTCSDNTACSPSDSSGSEDNTNGSTLSVADASTSDPTSDGVATDAMPSRGCTLGNATPALSLSYFSRDTTITLPEAYDGSTPLPMVLALHASGMYSGNGHQLSGGSSSAKELHHSHASEPAVEWRVRKREVRRVYRSSF